MDVSSCINSCISSAHGATVFSARCILISVTLLQSLPYLDSAAIQSLSLFTRTRRTRLGSCRRESPFGGSTTPLPTISCTCHQMLRYASAEKIWAASPKLVVPVLTWRQRTAPSERAGIATNHTITAGGVNVRLATSTFDQ